MQALRGVHQGRLLVSHGVPRPLPLPRGTVAVNANKPKVQVAVQEQADPQESPYFDSLCRSFLLGVGAGALVETVHMLGKIVQTPDVAGLMASTPLFLWDHVAAVVFWVALYGVEVALILSVYARYPDSEQAAWHLRHMVTLSKRMLPARLGVFKRAIYALATGFKPTTSLAAAPASSAATATTVAKDVAASAATPLAFVDTPVADVVADIAARSRAPLGLPVLPSPPQTDKQGQQEQRGPSHPTVPKGQNPAAKARQGLVERRSRKGLAPGQWDPAALGAMDKRSKELLERKSYLRNFWYCVALSEKLQEDKPLGVEILGSKVVLFREGNEIKCLDDTCPHRGAPLSAGWLSEPHSTGGHTCVVCPYHGWAIDGEGKLQDVPSAEPGRWPKRPIVSSYPVEERGGFIWLFWGDKSLPADERPPIPWAPELEDPSWKAVYGEIEFECGHWGVFENAIDMAHIHYLHNDSFGNSEKPRILDMTTSRDTFHVEANFSIHNKPVSKLWEWTAVESVPVVAKAMLPSSSAITIQLGAGVRMITFVNTVPISENKCINRFALVRNFAGWDGFDGWARKAMFKILGEDKVMVEKLTPERLEAEFSLGPDAPQVAFRKLRQEWIDMGYGVPPESIKPRRGLAPDM